MLQLPSDVRSASIPVGAAVVGLGLILLAPAASADASPAAPDRPERSRERPDPPPREAKAEPQQPRGTEPPVIYVPPRRGAPRARVGGGLRGAPALPTPLVLAPEHVAETVSARPSLFWYIDTLPGREAELVFTLIDPEQIDPIAELPLAPPKRPGIQRIDLDDYGIALRPDTEYEWSVTLVADGRQRSRDRISTGSLRRVAVPAALRLEGATAPTYAANGLWYDALASLSDAIDASPNDSALRRQRDALLRQADLEAALP
jgi:hypothetical protein